MMKMIAEINDLLIKKQIKMKYLILIIMFINSSPLLNWKENSYKTESNAYLIQTPSLAEQYYDRLEVKTNFPKILNKFLDRKALVRTEVPTSIWQNIKDSIDYESFKSEVVAIVPNFYSDTEIQSILNEYSNRPNVPITKVDFRRDLAQKVQSFTDVNFTNTVNSILSDNGYSPL